MWKTDYYIDSEFIFCGENFNNNEYHIVKKLSELLSKEKSKVKKIKIVGYSIAMLLENGKLFTWGSNETGNLGITRYFEDDVDFYEMEP